MTTTAPRPTRIGFRRDVRLFLTILVGFLVALIFALIMLLQRAVEDARQAIWDVRNVAAAGAAESFRRQTPERSEVPFVLGALRVRYGVDVIEWRRGTDRVISGPDGPGLAEVIRPLGGEELRFRFDDGPIRDLNRRFVMTAALAATAAFGGVLLLILYVPRITRPIEQMLDEARLLGDRAANVEESQYVVETFRNSIAKLREQEEELRVLHDAQKRRADELEIITATLTRSLSSGLLVLDRNGLVVEINSAGREILGTGDTPVAGQTISQLLGGGPFTDVIAADFASRAARAREEITLDGGRVAGITTVQLFDAADQYLGMLALFADLTGVRRLESRLRELQTLADLGEISAGIAHEFRNSLSTIRGYLTLLRRETSGAGEERIRRAEEEAVLLSRAVDSLLAFARPETLAPETVDLGQLARDVVRRLDDPATGIAFAFRGGPAPAVGDPVLLGRAIENILRNAIDAVREKPGAGHVTVVTASAPPSITVEDDGAGLDEADAPRLLLPFQSDKPTGMGLGLAIARKVVLLHGGTIALRGRRGEGASVTIELPAVT